MASPGRSRTTDLGLLVAYLRPERRRVAALALLLVATMLTPVAGVLLLGGAIDQAMAGGSAADVAGPGIAFLVVTLGGDLLGVLVVWRSVRLAWRVGNRLRLDLCRHALSLDMEWHSQHSPGLLIERIDGDIEAVVTFSSSAVLNLLGNAILLVGVLAVSLVVDWRAGVLIGAAAAIAVAMIIRMRTVAVAAHDAERDVQARLYGDLEERLGGLEDLRANGAGAYAVHRLRQHSSQWWRASRRAGLTGGSAYAASGTVFTVGAVLTLALGVWLTRAGQLTIGSTLVLFRFSEMIRDPIESMAEQLRELQKATAGAQRAARLLATAPAVVDGRGTPLPPGSLAVDLDSVRLVYDNGHVALDGLDLHLAPGTTLGVVGRTGSGKTSLARVVTRLWDVTGGSVRLGGVDVRATTDRDLRRRVAVISQDVDLLDASLRDNVTLFGALDASDHRITECLAAVGLGTWAASLPDGLGSRLDGRSLSAGEAQLLAFARVLLADAGLVVLDEATSRIDPATERALTLATERALAGRTAVIIAHRLATLDRVDEICVVEGGHIVEHGSRRELAREVGSRYGALLGQAAGPVPVGTVTTVPAVADADRSTTDGATAGRPHAVADGGHVADDPAHDADDEQVAS